MGSEYINNKEFENIIRLYIGSLKEQKEAELKAERERKRKNRKKKTTKKKTTKKTKRKTGRKNLEKDSPNKNLGPDPILAESVANYFYLLSENIVRAFRFSMVDEEDAKQEAVMVCIKKIDRFDTDRGKAFNYFTTMILNHYRQLYRSARNYGELKKRFLERQMMRVPQELRKGLIWYDSDSGENE